MSIDAIIDSSQLIKHRTDESFSSLGRRNFVEWRELGFEKTSGGKLRGVEFRRNAEQSTRTGWHYHTCEVQYIYALAGWADVQFADGKIHRMVPGTLLTIPGGVVHNECSMSGDWHGMEFSLPGDGFDTILVDDPLTAH